MSTVCPGAPCPAAESVPNTVAVFVTWSLPLTFFRFVVTFEATERVVGWNQSDCVWTVPAALTVPTSGVYGGHSARHTNVPAALGAARALVVKSASSSFAPKVARPGVPGGTSGGGRQTTSLNEASA